MVRFRGGLWCKLLSGARLLRRSYRWAANAAPLLAAALVVAAIVMVHGVGAGQGGERQIGGGQVGGSVGRDA